jgi:hypothetical protein
VNKAPKVFQTLHVLTQEKYYKTLCFLLSLTSENKNKKQKDIIAESKRNNFEHSPPTRKLSSQRM